jgi:hypothetical protein
MKAARAVLLSGTALLLSACAVTKPIQAVGNAALRAGGMSPVGEQKTDRTQADAGEPHWSENWVWEGDGH